MIPATENKIILVTQKTRLEQLIRRYNTEGQVRFYLEHCGEDFSDYKKEHENYIRSVNSAAEIIEDFGRVQLVDRDNVPRFIFGKKDIVIAIGRDGLVANVLKYLDAQPLIGVNPDPDRWEGVLLPFKTSDLRKLLPEVAAGRCFSKKVTLASAELSDGQKICAVNDLFIGQKTHTSARYEITAGGRSERQSSCGIIISTGLGATGWLRSILAGAAGICGTKPSLPEPPRWDQNFLYYTVREPFPTKGEGADIVFGRIEKNSCIRIVSRMPENGVIFSDGIEQDFLEFNSGASAVVRIADKTGNLITSGRAG